MTACILAGMLCTRFRRSSWLPSVHHTVFIAARSRRWSRLFACFWATLILRRRHRFSIGFMSPGESSRPNNSSSAPVLSPGEPYVGYCTRIIIEIEILVSRNTLPIHFLQSRRRSKNSESTRIPDSIQYRPTHCARSAEQYRWSRETL